MASLLEKRTSILNQEPTSVNYFASEKRRTTMKYSKINWLLILSVMLTLAILVAACGAPATEQTATEEPIEKAPEESAESDRCGDRSKLSEQLNFFNWADYIDEEILAQFEEECGVKVIMDLYTSNEEAVAKIQAGNSGYDVVIPTDYACGIMADDGLLMDLNMEDIPNA
jgi:spermidine/putrescine transport system substrate-binding protein